VEAVAAQAQLVVLQQELLLEQAVLVVRALRQPLQAHPCSVLAVAVALF
jgi:hypothetical protein